MQPAMINFQALLTEYDAIVTNIQQEVSRCKVEHEEIKEYVLHLVDDNKRLSEELRENVRARMVVVGHGDVEKDLQQQLELTNEAKEMVLEMWQLALQEIERLENAEKLKSSAPDAEAKRLQVKTAEIRQEYSKALEIMNKEVTISKADLRQSKNELVNVHHDLEKTKQSVAQLEQKVQEQDKECNEAKRKISQLLPRILELEAELATSQSSLANVQEELVQEKNSNQLLHQSVESLKLYRSNLETREAEAIQRAKESVLLAESALLEKDAAVFKERQASKEVQGLKDAMDEVVKIAAGRAKQEINNIKKKCNENIKQLLKEVQALEKENSEKQAMVERAIREKRAAEAELTALYNEGFQKDPQDAALFHDLSFRLTRVERERDDMKARAETLHNKLQLVEKSNYQENNHYKAEAKQLKETLRQVQNSFSTSNEERIHFAEQVQQLSHKCQASEDENAQLRKKLKQELSRFEVLLVQQQQEHGRQLQEAENVHQSTVLELRSLVDAQQHMGSKWKDEIRVMSERFEKEMKQMNSKLLNTKEANSKLVAVMAEVQQRASLAENQKNKHAIEVSELKKRIDEFNKAGLIL